MPAGSHRSTTGRAGGRGAASARSAPRRPCRRGPRGRRRRRPSRPARCWRRSAAGGIEDPPAVVGAQPAAVAADDVRPVRPRDEVDAVRVGLRRGHRGSLAGWWGMTRYPRDRALRRGDPRRRRRSQDRLDAAATPTASRSSSSTAVPARAAARGRGAGTTPPATASSSPTSAPAGAARPTPASRRSICRRTRPRTCWPTSSKLREHLGIERWQVWGASWGTELGLLGTPRPTLTWSPSLRLRRRLVAAERRVDHTVHGDWSSPRRGSASATASPRASGTVI